MDDNRKQELAFLYAGGRLEPDQMPIVFELILRDETFRHYLKEEVELRAALQRMRTGIDPSVKRRLLAEIERRMEPQDGGADADPEPFSRRAWGEWALQLATPPLVLPIIQTLQRRCLT